jgi:diaminopropionate ammonia-lyase
MCELLINPHRAGRPRWPSAASAFAAADIAPFHRSLPGYQPTPLVSLPALAAELGIGGLYVKDESRRFDLKAFKVLGASYAIYSFLKSRWQAQAESPFPAAQFHSEYYRWLLGPFTFCTATDGNHGRAVAWTAKLLGERAVIYMPGNTVPARVEAIRNEGAEVIIVDGDYDQAVIQAQRAALQNGWQVISDTSYSGYTEIPRWIMAGYLTMFREVSAARRAGGYPEFDCVIVQAGVGSLAATAAWCYTEEYRAGQPILVSVEPGEADCLLASAQTGSGEIRRSAGNQDSIMAGLNCGTPSLIAWPFIKDRFDAFLSISDRYATAAMRKYYYPSGEDQRLISGESGAAGLGALLALVGNPKFHGQRRRLGLGPDSQVLLLNTEGDTDPVYFDQVVRDVDTV